MAVFTNFANGDCHYFAYLYYFPTNYHSLFHFPRRNTSGRLTIPFQSKISVSHESWNHYQGRALVPCENCVISYGDFCVVYSGKVDLLVAFAQRHGLIWAEKKCPNCDNVCGIDYDRLSFRCDRSVRSRGKRRRYVYIFH